MGLPQSKRPEFNPYIYKVRFSPTPPQFSSMQFKQRKTDTSKHLFLILLQIFINQQLRKVNIKRSVRTTSIPTTFPYTICKVPSMVSQAYAGSSRKTPLQINPSVDETETVYGCTAISVLVREIQPKLLLL